MEISRLMNKDMIWIFIELLRLMERCPTPISALMLDCF